MIAWKQAQTLDLENIVLVKLDIPSDARVCHIPKGRMQCDRYRCDKAMVLGITSLDGKHRVSRARSLRYDKDFVPVIYEVGKMAYPSSYCGNKRKPIAPGLYFFWDKQQALEYIY
ncbi:MAG: DUF5758 domain-containing protein [Bacteroidales bacterium]|nr:DUF5758 domain-containing protein [Bacteroidales bacterium]